MLAVILITVFSEITIFTVLAMMFDPKRENKKLVAWEEETIRPTN